MFENKMISTNILQILKWPLLPFSCLVIQLTTTGYDTKKKQHYAIRESTLRLSMRYIRKLFKHGDVRKNWHVFHPKIFVEVIEHLLKLPTAS